MRDAVCGAAKRNAYPPQPRTRAQSKPPPLRKLRAPSVRSLTQPTSKDASLIYGAVFPRSIRQVAKGLNTTRLRSNSKAHMLWVKLESNAIS